MTTTEILQTCASIIITFNEKQNLQEFELLAYEQTCRTVEDLMKTIREKHWRQKHGESENY